MLTTLRPAAVLAIASLAAACHHGLDKKKIEVNIHDELAGKGVTMKSIDCPAGRPLKAGDAFDCTGVDSDGETLVFHVTQMDGIGTIKWQMDGMILNLAKIGDAMESKLGKAADIKCPEKSVIVKVGHSFTCPVDLAGKSKKVLLTLSDPQGNVTWKLLD